MYTVGKEIKNQSPKGLGTVRFRAPLRDNHRFLT